MPKKKNNSSLKKKSEAAGDKPVVQQTKPVPRPGKLGKEIDDIFGGRKKKKPELEKSEKEESSSMKKTEIAKRKRKRNETDGFNNNKTQTRPRKRTEEGLRVYTEDELGINKSNSGDTSLCPFDCQCCF